MSITGNRNFAWVVPIPDNEAVRKGVLTGKSLQAIRSSVDVLAVVTTKVSGKNMAWLAETFEEVIVRDISLNLDKTEINSLNGLLVSILKMRSVQRAVVLVPGVLTFSQCDRYFDEENDGILVIDKESKNWLMMLVTPNSCQAEQVSRRITDFESRADSMLSILQEIYATNRDVSVAVELNVDSKDNLRNKSKFFYLNRIISNDEWSFWDQHISGNFRTEERNTKDWIAVIGMSCRFPKANNLTEYWEILDRGINTSGSPPAARYSLVDGLDNMIKGNFLNCPLDQFDAKFFGMSPNEAALTDPQARLLLEISWEALEHAAVNPDQIRGSPAGVFCGSWIQDYKDQINEISSPSHEFLRKYLANGFGSTAAKLSFFYGLTGLNVCTESGCSSSLVATHLACASLLRRECPLAMVCGTNVILNSAHQAKVFSEDGISKTFDATADGFSRAEGVAVLILKRYSDAVSDQDNIQAIIRNSALSQEGQSKSFGKPTVESEYRVMRKALRQANLDPSQVDYLEAHATGTAVGDPIEAAAIVKAYCSKITRETPLWIGSGKTNIGHTEACSGLAGIIKVILAMQHNKIPRHLNLFKLNLEIDFSPIPGSIPLTEQLWPRRLDRPRVAGVSSFGISGTDAHVIIQEPPNNVSSEHESTKEQNKPFLLLLSAKNTAALQELVERYIAYLPTNTDPLSDIVFTAATCRTHHKYRLSCLAECPNDMCAKLLDARDRIAGMEPSEHVPKIVSAFPGALGKTDWSPVRSLYRENLYFREIMEEFDALFIEVNPQHNSLVQTLFSGETVFEVEHVMLITTYQYALAKLWELWGVKAQMVIGHCFGEMAAAIHCGMIHLAGLYRALPAYQALLELQNRYPSKNGSYTG